jgi:hypothetical protein
VADYITELHVDGAWQNITPDVRDSDPIQISRGRKDWASTTEPSTLGLKLNNGPSNVAPGVSGRYSPRNPRSDLFGKIGRNTPIRVRAGARQNHSLTLPGVFGSYVSQPDGPLSDIVGDIDVRIDVALQTWQPLDGVWPMLVAKADVDSGDNFSWSFQLRDTGTPIFQWSTDGGVGSGWSLVLCDTAIPADAGRLVVRVTLDVDDGAGNHVVTFYTGNDINGPWTVLDSQTIAGTTSIHSSSADRTIGGVHGGGPIFAEDGPLAGEVFAVQIRQGIDGTLRKSLDFSGHEPEARTVADAITGTWTLQNSATFTDDSIRFAGEVSKWPVRMDLSGADVWVPATASGILRRLQRGKKPLKSSLYRDLSTHPGVVAYWPLEEPAGAVQFNSGLKDDTSVLRPGDASEVTFAGDDRLVASAPLVTVNDTTIFGAVPTYAAAARQRFIMFVRFLPTAFATEKLLFRLHSSGSVAQWDVYSRTTGGLRLIALDRDGNTVEDQVGGAVFTGRSAMLSLLVQQVGADIDWALGGFRDGETSQHLVTGTITGETYGRFTRLFIGSTNDMEGTTFGHPAILNGDGGTLIWNVVFESLLAHAGETGIDRLVRLSADEGLPAVRTFGPSSKTEIMGPQRMLTLVELFQEVPTADLGLFGDRPDAVGVQHRSRADLYSQTPALTLDYRHGIIAEPFTPVDDDQATRNDIEVRRVRGSSFTAVQETGPLSVQTPPEGVGRYDVSQELNIFSDSRLSEQAFWRLHLGTVDEQRFPKLRLNLRNVRAAQIEDDILSVREGDIIQIDNPPDWLPGGPYLLFVEGINDEKTAATHFIEFNCSPGSAWTVGAVVADTDVVAPDAPSRADTAGSQLAATVTATAQTLSLATTSGPLWTTAPNSLYLEGIEADYLSTPNSPAFAVTDLDLRVDLHPATWRPPAAVAIARKYVAVTGGRSWVLWLDAAGTLTLRWSADGSAFLQTTSVAVPATSGRLAVRITMDVDNGAGGRVVTWYTAPTMAGPWTVLGAASTTAGTTAIHPSPSPIEVGRSLPGGVTLAYFTGRIHGLQLRNGIGGSIVANAVLDTVAAGAATFTDSLGTVWSTNGGDVTGDFPFDLALGGEVVRVHSITGAASPQTATVTRAVNRVEKPHPAGTAVALAHPARCAL